MIKHDLYLFSYSAVSKFVFLYSAVSKLVFACLLVCSKFSFVVSPPPRGLRVTVKWISIAHALRYSICSIELNSLLIVYCLNIIFQNTNFEKAETIHFRICFVGL